MMLADASLDAVPANYWKFFCISALVLLGTAVSIVSLWALTRKPAPVKIDDEPAINTRAKSPRFNHALNESRHGDVIRRLDGHDAAIDQLWTTMRQEDADTRKEMGAKFDSILLALGEIKGELKTK
jgi:hypothetical protein